MDGMKRMDETVRDYMEQFHMVSAGDHVLVGVSGGPDSVCLLRIFSELRPKMGFSLTAVHVEHGIRGEESRGDAAFTEALCRKLDVDLISYSVDAPQYAKETGSSLEEAARLLRYDCFARACAACRADRVALAHQADDCAETMLFHLARGTGIRGMAGIRPVSVRCASDTDGGTAGDGTEQWTVIRPLLCVTRSEIEDWLAERGQDYRTDATNADEAYTRNRIRARVLPELARINDQAVPHMQSASEQLAEVCDYMDMAARKAAEEICTVKTDPGADGQVCVAVSCAEFLALHEALRRHLVLWLLGEVTGSRRDITAGHVAQVMALMTARVGMRICLPRGVTAEKTYGTVMLSAKQAPARSLPDQPLAIPGETRTEDGLVFSAEILGISDISEKIPRKSYTKWFDYDKIKTVVHLRGRQTGDYLETDARGGHQTLKKYLINEKVPAAQRDGLWLLADDHHILWVVGYRISEAYKVTAHTRRILQVCVDGANQAEGETDGGKD